MRKEEFYFPSRDNQTKIHAVRWIPETVKPCCIVQIVHGMAEYVERYEELAAFLTEHHVLVTGEDHLGHGKSVQEDKDLGYFCEQDPATVVVRDVHRLKKMTQELYPGVPYFILGHSMGSFITRNYLCRYGSGIQGAVICGTGMQPAGLLIISKLMANVQRLFLGDRHVAAFIDKCAFGAYNKKIENPRTSKDWLTRDEAVVDAYLMDSRCGFTFTVNGFRTLFELIWRIRKKDNLRKIPRELPVFMISGDKDPVGDYGRGVRAAYASMEEAGMTKLSMKLYEGGRHELFNENNRAEVMQDVWKWCSDVIGID